MSLGFVKPSVWRAVWWIIVVALVCCVVFGIALYIGILVTHPDDGHTSTGDYVRLFVVSIAFYAPMFLLIPWWITIPAILVLGTFAASVRRNPAADASSELPAPGT